MEFVELCFFPILPSVRELGFSKLGRGDTQFFCEYTSKVMNRIESSTFGNILNGDFTVK